MLLIHGASELVLVSESGCPLRGAMMSKPCVLRNEHPYSIVIDNGCIADFGPDSKIMEIYSMDLFTQLIDAKGKCVLPGLIDAHTHPVWAGDRVEEFSLKLQGASYMDIHKFGGGIHFTVEHTRQASEDQLYNSLLQRLSWALKAGTTTVEAKTGYGLDLDSEVKLLRVLNKASQLTSVPEISVTFCGAHAVPKGQTAEEVTENIVSQQLPALKTLINEEGFKVENCDVFCEMGVFNIEQTRRILECARKECGMVANFHGDELHPTKSAELAVEIGARAVSHLECVSSAGVDALSRSSCAAVLLPTTAYVMRLPPPPVRHLIDSGALVALGSDFNPNAYCYSMPMVMNFACCFYRFSVGEALVAATINAAAALGREKTHGSITIGKTADLLIIDAPRWEHLIYQIAGHDRLIEYVIKKGDIVYKRPHINENAQRQQF